MDNFDRAREGRQTVDIESLQDRVRRLEQRVSTLESASASADHGGEVCVDCGKPRDDHHGVRHMFKGQ